MPKLWEIAETLNAAYPFEDACGYDNVGLLVGRKDREIKRVLIALDVTFAVLEEAIRERADLILSHHPVIFREIKKVTDESYTGAILLRLIEGKIAAIALHTNFDRGEEGNNDLLARTLGAGAYEKIEEGFATEFDLSKVMPLASFAKQVKETLGDAVVRVVGEGSVKKVIASCGAGIGESLILRAKEKDAVIVTADVKHNYASMAKDLGVRVVETTHFASEWGFTERIKEFMAEKFDGVELLVSKENINPYD